MVRKNIWRIGWALAVALFTLAAGSILLDMGPAFGPLDEFGRNAIGATLVAVGNSLVTAFWMAAIVLAPPVIAAYGVATIRSSLLDQFTYGVTRTLDVIPLFLWVAIAYVSLGSSGTLLKLVSISVVSFPFVMGLCLPRFRRIATAPFSLNATAARTPFSIRIWQHFMPNALPVLAYPFVVIFGVCVTFDAALGLLGMGTRSDLSLGMLLLRAKERVPIDGDIGWSATGALAVCLLVFWLLRTLLVSSDSEIRNAKRALDAPISLATDVIRRVD